MDSFGEFFDQIRTTFSTGLGAVTDLYRVKAGAQIAGAQVKLNKARIDAQTQVQLQRLKAATNAGPIQFTQPATPATPAFASSGLVQSMTPTTWALLGLVGLMLLTQRG